MKAILSCTDNPLYSFFLPIATWSWEKIGVESIVFIPEKKSQSFIHAIMSCPKSTRFETLRVAPDREPTYFQCVRLYAAALEDISSHEALITSDIDMAVFKNPVSGYLFRPGMSNMVIAGSDLVPEGQYPMCYAAAMKYVWKNIMEIEDKTVNQCLSKLLDHIVCDNFRGNYWGKDQGTLWEQVQKSGFVNNHQVGLIERRKSDRNRTATNRADRDGWTYDPKTIIDAHLPRPGYELLNFEKILNLFKDVYPTEDFSWMINYRNAYLTLINTSESIAIS